MSVECLEQNPSEIEASNGGNHACRDESLKVCPTSPAKSFNPGNSMTVNPHIDLAQATKHLLALAEGLSQLFPEKSTSSETIQSSLIHQSFNLLILGEYKRGKTSLANRLLGESFLPTGVTPLTSVPTVLSHGSAPSIEVQLVTGQTITIDFEQLPDYVTEEANPENYRGVEEVRITSTSPFLANGIRLIDTPGIGSIHENNTTMAHAQLSRCDAALLVLSADQPLTRIEAEFLSQLGKFASRIIVVLNEVDQLHVEDRLKSLCYIKTSLKKLIDWDIPVIPYSCKDAPLLPGLAPSSDTLVTLIEQSLVARKMQLCCEGALRRLAELQALCRFETDLQKASMSLSATVIAERHMHFQLGQKRIRSEIKIVLDSYEKELDARVQEWFGSPLSSWIRAAEERITHALLDRAASLGSPSPATLKEILTLEADARVAIEVKELEASSTEQLERCFSVATKRVTASIEGLADHIHAFAAELYEIPKPACHLFSLQIVSPSLDNSFPDEPSGLEWLGEVILPEWPSSWAAKLPKIHTAVMTFERRRITRRIVGKIEDQLALAVGRFRQALIATVRLRLQEISARAEYDLIQFVDEIDKALRSAMISATASQEHRSKLEELLLARHQWLESAEKELAELRLGFASMDLKEPTNG